jgi:hypothetical protein
MYRVILTLVIAVASLMGFKLKNFRNGVYESKTSTADFKSEWKAKNDAYIQKND